MKEMNMEEGGREWERKGQGEGERERSRKIRNSSPLRHPASGIFRNLPRLSSEVREQSARGSKYQQTNAQPRLPLVSPQRIPGLLYLILKC